MFLKSAARLTLCASPLPNNARYTLQACRSLSSTESKAAAKTRRFYKQFVGLQTRWNDNDAFGHINNIIYYQFFDDAVNHHLLNNNVGIEYPRYVVQSGCQYFKPLAYPVKVEIGLSVDRIGSSSVSYTLGAFAEGDTEIAAMGEFVHVYVDDKGTPRPLDDTVKAVLEQLV